MSEKNQDEIQTIKNIKN